ncbi:TULIP family P47-like protein [Brevibacillus laterosporus]|uniref:TULIP family P47-like protein n=1 Tax=Brevibacillus laterosporus TaxID=1465 RepID=UPI0035A66D69
MGNYQDYDTFGWDTVFGISFEKANQAIKNLKTSPSSFDQESKTKKHKLSRKIEGKWGDWQLTTNGDGKNLAIKCPIDSGNFTKYIDGGDPLNYDLTNQWIEVEVELNFLDSKDKTYSDSTAKSGTGIQKNLLVRTSSNDQEDPAVSIKATSYTSETFDNDDDDDPSEINKAICDLMFETWFNDNLDQFKHVFSIFIVGQTSNDPQFQWLKPTSVSYATTTIQNKLDQSVFGVMAMTENRLPVKAHEIDYQLLLATKTHSAFAINRHLFVREWILSGLLAMLPGISKDDFTKTDELIYTNKHDMQWSTFKSKDDHNVPATVDANKFEIGLSEDRIMVSFRDLHWEVKSGITAYVNYTEYYKLELKSGTDSKGKSYNNILTVTQDGPTSITTSYQVAEWEREKNLIIEITSSIAGAVLGGIVGGAFDGFIEAAVEGAANAAIEAGEETMTIGLDSIVDGMSSEYSEEIIQLETWSIEEASSEIEEAANSLEEGVPESSVLSKVTGKVKDIGKFIYSNKFKLIGGIVGGATGAGLGMIPTIIDNQAQQNFSHIPSLDNFAKNCVEAVKWPDSKDFELTSATITTGGIILGGNLTSN